MNNRKDDERIARVEVHVENIKEDVREIKEAVTGKNGIATQTALNKQSTARLWWLFGICGVGGFLLKVFV